MACDHLLQIARGLGGDPRRRAVELDGERRDPLVEARARLDVLGHEAGHLVLHADYRAFGALERQLSLARDEPGKALLAAGTIEAGTKIARGARAQRPPRDSGLAPGAGSAPAAAALAAADWSARAGRMDARRARRRARAEARRPGRGRARGRRGRPRAPRRAARRRAGRRRSRPSRPAPRRSAPGATTTRAGALRRSEANASTSAVRPRPEPATPRSALGQPRESPSRPSIRRQLRGRTRPEQPAESVLARGGPR